MNRLGPGAGRARAATIGFVKQVLDIRRHPLKSAAVEHLDQARLGEHGLDGDRTWVCVDQDGTIGSAKQPRLWGRLLEIEARIEAGADAPTLTVPGEKPVLAGTPEADAAVSALLGRPVRVSRTAPPQATRHHWWPSEPGMIPEWAKVEPGSEATIDFRDSSADGRFYDFGTVHLVTSGALARLGEEHGGPVDPSRFRPNLVVDLDADPEPGTRLRLGPDAEVEVRLPTPRCVIPSLAHGPDGADRTILTTLARHHRIEVPGLGKATCFGFYADVIATGTLTVGDAVAVV